MSVGAEYNLMQLVQLRTGYHYGERRDYYPSYWTVGAGVRILHLRLDFAYLFAKKHTLLQQHLQHQLRAGFLRYSIIPSQPSSSMSSTSSKPSAPS